MPERIAAALLENKHLLEKDHFLRRPPLQPKAEVAKYVETKGILVPRRFDSLSSALRHVEEGKQIIIRSEHTQEYAGASGLLKSYILDSKTIAKGQALRVETGSDDIDWQTFDKRELTAQWKIRDRILSMAPSLPQADFEENLKRMSLWAVTEHCSLFGMDPRTFLDKTSFSYWEKLGGYNRSMVADSAIQGRYHIFTSGSGDYTFCNYSRIENNHVVMESGSKMPDELIQGFSKNILFYERIRRLKKFDPTHCPIIEFQTVDTKDYFLQYHRTRNQELSRWRLERELEEGEFESMFVRGVTPPEGIIVNTAAYYANKYAIENPEEASFDFHWYSIFSEIMSRKRVVNFDYGHPESIGVQACEGHMGKSKIFNPAIFVSISNGKLPEELIEKLFQDTQKDRKSTRLNSSHRL